MLRLLIIDDHPIVLEGTKNLFKDVNDIIVETNNDISSLLQLLSEKKNVFDVYLIDINMPEKNGVTLSEEILALQPTSSIILYTGDNIEDYYSLILTNKVHGLLSKTASKEKIMRTIRSVIAGELLISKTFIQYIQNEFMGLNVKNNYNLNERDKRILQYVAKGYTNSAIALELQVTQRTIERNLSLMFELFNVSSRTEAVLVAKEKNLI